MWFVVGPLTCGLLAALRTFNTKIMTARDNYFDQQVTPL